MARSLNRLSDRAVRTVGAGMFCDGGGLYLQVTPGKEGLSRSWLFRFATTEIERTTNPDLGRERYAGLGSYPAVTLAEARQKAADARRLRQQKIDPIAHRDREMATAATSQAKTTTFAKAAEKYIASHEAGWRSTTDHRQHDSQEQWTNSIKMHVNPVLGHLVVRDIDTGLVMQVLEPIWTTIPPTAERVRGRIERVLGWAKVNGFREGENPARWRDHLDQLLPARSKIHRVEPQPALPYAQVPEFMSDLKAQQGTAARALEFAILCVSRSNEVRGMQWSELAGNVWVIPPNRVKSGREHRIPLSAAAMVLIEGMRERRRNNFIFPAAIEGKSLSREAFSEVIQRINKTREARRLPRYADPNQNDRDIVQHGFRSSFKDWASECTNFRDAVSEAALGHVSADKVKLAYERTTFEKQRRELAEVWAQFCASPVDAANNVVPLRSV